MVALVRRDAGLCRIRIGLVHANKPAEEQYSISVWMDRNSRLKDGLSEGSKGDFSNSVGCMKDLFCLRHLLWSIGVNV